MQSLGFTRGKCSPCTFYHREQNIRAVIHGDDFTLLGIDKNLDWFRAAIQAKWQVKIKGRLGPDPHDTKIIHVLNRLVEWCEDGIHYEADQRHADILVKTLSLDNNANGSPVPGTSEEVDLEDSSPLLSPQQTSLYRALTARAIYLSQDRTDIAFATKELSRQMSAPTESSWTKLKRLGRYLSQHRRFVNIFGYQSGINKLSVWSDTDWAGCKKTRKSTCGGIICLGRHILKSYSTTQSVIAQSSAEAEYYGMTKAASVGIGIRGMFEDFGVSLDINLLTDASSAKGIAMRIGLGKIRHLETSQLWLQSKVANGSVTITKISGKDNISDVLTKYLSGPDLSEHIKLIPASRTNRAHPNSLSTTS
jgi:hypothetical protein